MLYSSKLSLLLLLLLISCASAKSTPWEDFKSKAQPGTPEFIAREAYATRFYDYIAALYSAELKRQKDPASYPQKGSFIQQNRYIRPLYRYFHDNLQSFEGSYFKFVSFLVENRDTDHLIPRLIKQKEISPNEIFLLVTSSLLEETPYGAILLITVQKNTAGNWELSGVYQRCDVCISKGKVKDASGKLVTCPKCKGEKFLVFSYDYLFKYI